MDTKKRMGIWMDHSGAQLLEFSGDAKPMIKIPLNVQLHPEEGDNYDDESKMLHKEKNSLASFYKKIVPVIRDFDELLLFGPTNAKSEFHNFLRKDAYFDQMKITTMTTDKLSGEQKHHFVTDFFKRFEIKNF